MSESTRTVVVVVAIAVLLPLLWGTMMMGGMMGPWMMGGWGGGGSVWPGMLMPILWLLIVAGIGLGAVWAFRQTAPGGAGGSGGQPLDILKERYARGELTREQYEQMRQDLQ